MLTRYTLYKFSLLCVGFNLKLELYHIWYNEAYSESIYRFVVKKKSS